MKRRVLEQFGISAKGAYAGNPFRTNLADIKNAMQDKQMLAICGKIGSGKSVLLKQAVREIALLQDRTKFIYVRSLSKARLTIESIVNAILYDFEEPKIRRDFEARSRQVTRVLGTAHVTDKLNIVVIIDQAHLLHGNTIRALQELFELTFNNVSPLLSIVLVGHESLVSKLNNYKEVFWRSNLVMLNESNGWMTYQERINYIKAVWGNAISAKARERIAVLAHVPLEIDVFVESKMNEAYNAGKKQLDEETIEVPLIELFQALDVSLQDVANEAGIGKTTVHDVLHNANSKQVPAVKKALEKLQESKKNQSQFREAV